MLILFIELLIIVILVMIFSMLIVDDRRNRTRGMHLVKLKGYWDGAERRSVDRLNISLQVKYFENGTAQAVKSADISLGGIRLLLDEKIEKGTPLRVEIKLPDESSLIKARGKVVWAEESQEDEKTYLKRLFNTGIKFSKFQDSDDRRLFDFIRNLQAQKR
ncbi:MAG: PilZ domain-containing protein [Candidatus Omnitrophota bacterium]